GRPRRSGDQDRRHGGTLSGGNSDSAAEKTLFHCLGGTIALEIAQQLRRAGESVAVLAMLETYNLEGLPAVSFPLRTIHKAQNLYFHLMNLLLSLSRGGFDFFL